MQKKLTPARAARLVELAASGVASPAQLAPSFGIGRGAATEYCDRAGYPAWRLRAMRAQVHRLRAAFAARAQ